MCSPSLVKKNEVSHFFVHPRLSKAAVAVRKLRCWFDDAMSSNVAYLPDMRNRALYVLINISQK